MPNQNTANMLQIMVIKNHSLQTWLCDFSMLEKFMLSGQLIYARNLVNKSKRRKEHTIYIRHNNSRHYLDVEKQQRDTQLKN